jgi:uncharacterized protein (TIGR03083 family)
MERTPGTLYRESLERVTEIVSSLDERALATTVAATPKWSGRDVLAHLAGAAEDFCSGNLDGAGGEAWTSAQVARAEGKSIDDLVDAWNRVCDNTVAALDHRQMPLFSMWDVITHEADLRETHQTGRLDAAVVDEALAPLWSMFAKRYPGPGRLDVQAGERTLSMGEGEPALSLTITPYELFRGMLSRRSRAQMSTWEWSGDPSVAMRHMTVFGLREDDQPIPSI